MVISKQAGIRSDRDLLSVHRADFIFDLFLLIILVMMVLLGGRRELLEFVAAVLCGV